MSTEQTRRILDKASMGIEDGLPLAASDGDLAALRRDIQRLMDMEAIRQLKYAYFRCLDTANFAELATLFHDDVEVHFKGGNYEWRLTGKQAYLDNVRQAFTRHAVGHHNGHHPEIQMLSDTEATGIWYLADNMWILDHKFYTSGTALYWDRYEKVAGRWLIRETRYELVYEINTLLDEPPPLSSHYLGVHGPDAAS
jgi:hypothetical protein